MGDTLVENLNCSPETACLKVKIDVITTLFNLTGVNRLLNLNQLRETRDQC